MLSNTVFDRMILLLIMINVLIACTAGNEPTTPTAEPTRGEGRFRSDRFHLDVALLPGWAAAEGPEQLAWPYTGLVAFNSWNEPRFWAPEVAKEGSSIYSPGSVLGQMPDDGAYIVLIHFSGGPPPEHYGPEYEQEDLSGLWKEMDCRKGRNYPGVTYLDFFKWGRPLRLEVYCKPKAADETAAAVNALLASWRFDQVPAGEIGWAVVKARQLLPSLIEPAKFPIVSEGPKQSLVGEGNIARITQAQFHEETVVVTFMYRWDEPPVGSNSDDCSFQRCHWWKFEARSSGEVVLVEEGGAALPGGQ